MKPTKLMLGTMILGLGMTGAAWAQPAPSHDRDAAVHGSYTTDRGDVNRAHGNQDEWRKDRDDVYRGGYNPYLHQRGDGDRDRDDRGGWSARDQHHDGNVWRGDSDARSSARSSWKWGHSDMRRGKTDDR
jgi:hypothetical protein